MNFNVPEDVKDRLNRTFARESKSALATKRLQEAIRDSACPGWNDSHAISATRTVVGGVSEFRIYRNQYLMLKFVELCGRIC